MFPNVFVRKNMVQPVIDRGRSARITMAASDLVIPGAKKSLYEPAIRVCPLLNYGKCGSGEIH